MRLLLFTCFASLLAAQVPADWQIKATPASPRAGEKVVLEIDGLSKTPSGLTIDWDKAQGDGVFNRQSGVSVEFTPGKAGDLVVIICNLSGGLKKEIRKELRVAGEAAAPQQSSLPVPKTPPAKPILPTSPHQSETLPPDAKRLADIVPPNEAFVAPAGWMGDALTAGAVSLVGAEGCKFDADCVSITYDVPKRKEGFVAFAWQVVPQGEKWNWGEHKGVDLSGNGFRSLRIFAKADQALGVLPRVEFKTGGNIDPKFASAHTNSYPVSTGPKSLTSEWQLFCLDVSSARALKDVVSPLTIVVSSALNPDKKLGLFIDGVHFSKLPCGQ